MSDVECHHETYSWWHFNSEQIDPYWMPCDLTGPHEEHQNEYTGLKWKDKIFEEVVREMGRYDPEIDGPTPKNRCTIPNCRDHDEEELMGIENVDDLKPEPVEMDIQPVGLMMQYQDRARVLVFEYVKAGLEKTDNTEFNEYDVYVVWYTYTLGHWKCLVSTMLPDGMYYEVTHNSNKGETYVDAYKKFDNFCVTDDDFDEGMRVGWPGGFKRYVSPGSIAR